MLINLKEITPDILQGVLDPLGFPHYEALPSQDGSDTIILLWSLPPESSLLIKIKDDRLWWCFDYDDIIECREGDGIEAFINYIITALTP